MHPLVLQIQGELRGAWRFRRVALAAAWGGALLGWAIIAFLPNQYEAQARIFVDTQSVLKPLLQGLAVETDVMTKVNMISRTLLSRPQLERVARETGLSLRAVGEKEQQALIDGLAETIEIRQTQMANLFTITYRDQDRAMAQRVVQELLDSLVEDTMGVNRSDSTNAQRFLADQIRDYEQRLTEAETRLADFKKRNIGSMPDERGGYYTRLQAAMNEQERLTTQLQVAQARQAEIERQLSGEEPSIGLMSGFEKSSGLSATDEALAKLRAERERLLVRFTDQHPEVVSINETITSLEQRRKEEERSVSVAAREGSLARNPVYQDLRIAFNQAALQATTLRGQLVQAQNEVASLRRAINVIPEVEAELARLNRDYQVTKAQYESLLQRLESARISQDAEQSNDEIKFRVIDPAVAAIEPVAPKRALLQSMTLGAALFLGLALAVGLHLLSPVFASRQSLAELTGFPVIGVISECRTASEMALLRRQTMLLAGGAAALLVMFVAVLLLQEPAVRLVTSLVRGGAA
jgi:polysaccharide chain length determinant protein (PEP-CTERM system associated)